MNHKIQNATREQIELAKQQAWSQSSHGEHGYIDFECANSYPALPFVRVTFVLETGAAYAMVGNPKATDTNDEENTTGEEVKLSWEEAEEIVGQKIDIEAEPHSKTALQASQTQIVALQGKLCKALYDLTEWGKAFTSPLDADSPHQLLINAVTVLDEVEKLKMQPQEPTAPRLPEATRRELYHSISHARDLAFWAEDALGISGDSLEKQWIDNLLNRLAVDGEQPKTEPKAKQPEEVFVVLDYYQNVLESVALVTTDRQRAEGEAAGIRMCAGHEATIEEHVTFHAGAPQK